jgi:hypothetical protein
VLPLHDQHNSLPLCVSLLVKATHNYASPLYVHEIGSLRSPYANVSAGIIRTNSHSTNQVCSQLRYLSPDDAQQKGCTYACNDAHLLLVRHSATHTHIHRHQSFPINTVWRCLSLHSRDVPKPEEHCESQGAPHHEAPNEVPATPALRHTHVPTRVRGTHTALWGKVSRGLRGESPGGAQESPREERRGRGMPQVTSCCC